MNTFIKTKIGPALHYILSKIHVNIILYIGISSKSVNFCLKSSFSHTSYRFLLESMYYSKRRNCESPQEVPSVFLVFHLAQDQIFCSELLSHFILFF
jgi:hypothetical protein